MTERPGDIPVPLGECRCPGTPHAGGDVAWLLPRLSFEGGAAADHAVLSFDFAERPGRNREFEVALGVAYLKHQVRGWNLVDEEGKQRPYDAAELLSDWFRARPVAEKADELYSEGLLAPLVEAASRSSADGPTAPSTSRRTTSASKRQKP